MKTGKRLVFGIAAFLAFLLVWGLAEPYFVSVEEETAAIPHLSTAWAGKKIAVISDFQVGMWMDNDGVLPQTVQKIREEKPQILLLLGDFVYHATDSHQALMAKVIDDLRPLTEDDLKIYAVLGNHDYSLAARNDPVSYDTANSVKSMLEEIGVVVLNNESVALSIADNRVTDAKGAADALYLVGLGSNWAGENDADKAFEGVPRDAARFVLMHHPKTFTLLKSGFAPAAVAGHTHGGQFRWPFSPQSSYLDLVKKEDIPVDGWIKNDDGAQGNRLYVNRGIGMSLVPLRLNCPPEITLFTLQARQL